MTFFAIKRYWPVFFVQDENADLGFLSSCCRGVDVDLYSIKLKLLIMSLNCEVNIKELVMTYILQCIGLVKICMGILFFKVHIYAIILYLIPQVAQVCGHLYIFSTQIFLLVTVTQL